MANPQSFLAIINPLMERNLMRIARIATWTCALAVVLMAGAATVARADAPPSASAAELKDALFKRPQPQPWPMAILVAL